jgi:hypothetical protein
LEKEIKILGNDINIIEVQTKNMIIKAVGLTKGHWYEC